MAGTSNVPNPGMPFMTLDSTPVAKHANYFDAGAQQRIIEGLTVGVDGYYKLSRDLIDEGQFGAPIILTPFNYAHGIQYGLVLDSEYTMDNFSAYGNVAFGRAKGKDWITSQFNFVPQQYFYVLDHSVNLDHDQAFTASSGFSYKWGNTLFDADLIHGSGLRQDSVTTTGLVIPNGGHVDAYTQVNLGVVEDLSFTGVAGLSARFDVVNLFDEKYEIRSGSGVGVFAPQWGPRRGFFGGLSESF